MCIRDSNKGEDLMETDHQPGDDPLQWVEHGIYPYRHIGSSVMGWAGRSPRAANGINRYAGRSPSWSSLMGGLSGHMFGMRVRNVVNSAGVPWAVSYTHLTLPTILRV